MAFVVQDYYDLTHLLHEHPEWRTELRRLLLSDELLTLPEIVRELAAAQQRTETRLESLEATVRDLAEAQKRTETRIEKLVQAQERTEYAITKLTEEMKWAKDHLGDLLGWRLEARYREKAGVFFEHWLRPVAVVPLEALRETLEAKLSEEQVDEIMLLDLLIQGRARRVPDTPEVWLAFEISGVIDLGDVERVERRTALLHRAGYRAVPVVAGQGLTPEANRRLQEEPIILMLDGRSQGWERALAAA
ncbi:MAG: hypothetical protein HY741_27040 [Chloroflexi bacterium]|nr:hypothetical protein [Chloroflexota bacterium]